MSQNKIIKKLEFLVRNFRGAALPIHTILGIIQVVDLELKDKSDKGPVSRVGMLLDQSKTVIQRIDAMQANFGLPSDKVDFLRKIFVTERNDHLIQELVKYAEELSDLVPNIEIARALLDYASDASKGFTGTLVNVANEEVSLLATRLIQPNPNDRILSIGNDFLSSIQLELNSLVTSLSWENTSDSRLAEVILKIAGAKVEVSNVHYLGLGLKYFENQGKYTKAIIAPPWGARIDREANIPLPIRATSAESLFIQYALEATTESVLAILPPGFLFRTAGPDQELKKWLIEEGYVRAVIRLPNKTMPGTSIFANFLLLDKSKKHSKVLFLDASTEPLQVDASVNTHKLHLKVEHLLHNCAESENCRVVSQEELVRNNYNLDVARYCIAHDAKKAEAFFEGRSTARLDEVAEIVRAQATGPSKMGEIEIAEVNPSAIARDGGLDRDRLRYVKIDELMLGRLERQKIIPGDVVLAIKGTIGKTGVFLEEPDAGDIYAGQSFVILRLKKESKIADPIVLYSYLSCTPIQALIESKAVGVTVRSIKMDDLRSLPVIIEDEKMQKRVVESHNEIRKSYEKIDKITKEIELLKDQPWGIGEDL